jgi:vancomycin resistance protein YoaR
MITTNLKLKLVALAAIFAFFALPGVSLAQEAPAYTLKASDKEFKIDTAAQDSWKQAKQTTQEIYFLEPQTDLDQLVLEQLGLKEQQKKSSATSKFNIAAIYKSLRALEKDINTQTKDADIKIENKRAVVFEPGQKGRSLDVKASIEIITKDLEENKNESTLAVSEILPTKDLGSLNNLGIKELIARGSSNFRGSPRNRIHNITVGTEKERGWIIAPGEEFSFNKYLGEVDGEHGFLPELVIKKTGTVPEFGGGLCQVSSTVFRAAMNAGLPILERRNHSYAVQYYAPQGTDATIYPGVVDLRFKNDTSAHILIWPVLEKETNSLHFDIYGTKDSRKVVLDNPYSYDRQSSGAMKAVWSRTVTMPNGEVKKVTFNSNYQSPALFHKVETFPANEPTPPPVTPAPTEPTQPEPETPTNES